MDRSVPILTVLMSLFRFSLWILYFPLNLVYFRLFPGTEMAHTPAHHYKWSDLHLADQRPCRVVETLALRWVFLTFLFNIPTEKSW